MLFYDTGPLKIYNDDCTKVPELKDGSVDLIITSPPYNVDLNYNSYKDSSSYAEYMEFNRRWLTRMLELGKDDARFCLNVPLDKHKSGHQSSYADITVLAQEVGWKYQTTIIWNKSNISKRTAWGSWKSASAPNVIAPVEVLVVFYKNSWKKLNPGDSTITGQEFQDYTNGMWTFNGETNQGGWGRTWSESNLGGVNHPAPFPVELPMRCIKLFSYESDVVLDPFLGTGTTLAACALTRRKGVGIELDVKYCEASKTRLEKAQSPSMFNDWDSEEPEPRLP